MDHRIKYFCIATFGWLAYMQLIALFWGYYGSHHPFLDWALQNLLPDHRIAFHALIYTHDTVITILLAIPAGAILGKALPYGSWGYVAAATVIVFLWEYRVVLSSVDSALNFLATGRAWFGIVTTLVLLPFVYFLAMRLGIQKSDV